MKNYITILFLIFSHFVIYSSDYPENVRNVLRQSGKNRSELEKVLKHYRSDSLKYKAACFLIVNMDIHVAVSHYWADSLNNRISFNEFDYPDYETAVKEFNAKNSDKKLHVVPIRKPDVGFITAKYLIRNINAAFEIFPNNRTDTASFNLFCEFMLPYRVLDEPFTEWRDAFKKKFEPYTKPLNDKIVKQKCSALSAQLRSWFTNTYNVKQKKSEPSRLSPDQILFRRQGMCEDMANWGVYILRSNGIASTVDFTPAWGTSTGSHYWNVAFSENRTPISFFMGDDTPEEFFMIREPSKVLRVTYGKQNSSLAGIATEEEIPECFLRSSNYIDVTKNYWKVSSLTILLDSSSMARRFAYVGVFNGLNWRPVWWGKVKNRTVDFSEMSCGVVYLPMYYRNRLLIPAANPVVLRPDGKIDELNPDVYSLRTVNINEQDKYLKFRSGKKYTLYYWQNKWCNAGVSIANNSTILTFENIPSNALMILIPEYSEGKERPFTIDRKGLREWW